MWFFICQYGRLWNGKSFIMRRSQYQVQFIHSTSLTLNMIGTEIASYPNDEIQKSLKICYSKRPSLLQIKGVRIILMSGTSLLQTWHSESIFLKWNKIQMHSTFQILLKGLFWTKWLSWQRISLVKVTTYILCFYFPLIQKEKGEKKEAKGKNKNDERCYFAERLTVGEELLSCTHHTYRNLMSLPNTEGLTSCSSVQEKHS